MGGLDHDYGRPPLQPKGPPTVSKKDMEYIRKVFDAQVAKKKNQAINSPREDAQMFRCIDKHAVPCECITELYELLWRWGHRKTDQPGFVKNFGFAIPDTVIIVKGRPYAWYFVSKKDGSLLRKNEQNLSVAAVEKAFCRERTEGESPICATWLPIASQFPEARCFSQLAEFLTPTSCTAFLKGLHAGHSGIIQAFVEPYGVSNFLVRTVQYKDQTALNVRTNRSVLASGRSNIFDRCATFEGWEGLSSSCSRYRWHGQPLMEEQILEAGEALNQRIEQERVRQMLFLEPTQHVALHFKVSKDNFLYFIYASVVSEKDVILQTRPQLLMRDASMTDDLRCQALLAGGTSRRATPYGTPTCLQRYWEQQAQKAAYNSTRYEDVRFLADGEADDEETFRDGSLPSLQKKVSVPHTETSLGSSQIRSLSARRPKDFAVLPRVPYDPPAVPLVPYRVNNLQHNLQESGRYEYPPPFFGGDVVKRPLITANSARSDAVGFPTSEGSLTSRYP